MSLQESLGINYTSLTPLESAAVQITKATVLAWKKERQRYTEEANALQRKVSAIEAILQAYQVLDPDLFETLELGDSAQETHTTPIATRKPKDQSTPSNPKSTTDEYLSIGAKVRAAREGAGLSRPQLGDVVGYSYATVYAIEHGYMSASRKAYEKFLDWVEQGNREALPDHRLNISERRSAGKALDREVEHGGASLEAIAAQLEISIPELAEIRQGSAKVPFTSYRKVEKWAHSRLAERIETDLLDEEEDSTQEEVAPDEPLTMAQREIVESHMSLCHKIAQRYWNIANYAAHFDYDDLISIGYVAMAHAVRRWNPKVSKFTTFAHLRIRGAMQDFLRGKSKKDWQLDVASISMDQDDPIEGIPIEYADESIVQTDEILSTHETRGRLLQSMRRLEKRDRELLFRYYWMDQTMGQIAAAAGLTESRIYQRHSAAIRKIQGALA